MIGSNTTTVFTFGCAWLASALTLGVHVADEARHDFLNWYNPQALRIRARLRGLPFPPTFTFWPWLGALCAAVLVLMLLTPLAFTATPSLVGLAYAVAIIHVLNGLLHVSGAVRSRRAVPGIWSAPLLIAAGAWLWYAAGQLH
jgi:hypothetical protein